MSVCFFRLPVFFLLLATLWLPLQSTVLAGPDSMELPVPKAESRPGKLARRVACLAVLGVAMAGTAVFYPYLRTTFILWRIQSQANLVSIRAPVWDPDTAGAAIQSIVREDRLLPKNDIGFPLDGWNRMLQIDAIRSSDDASWVVRLRSAGEDGKMRTVDDLIVYFDSTVPGQR